MFVAQKTRFRCGSCDADFYITVCPKLCPLCGSSDIHKGSKKAAETAGRQIRELENIIPRMNEICAELSVLYSRYSTLHETLKVYSTRGIIEKNTIPKFSFPKFTEEFYASRKKRK